MLVITVSPTETFGLAYIIISFVVISIIFASSDCWSSISRLLFRNLIVLKNSQVGIMIADRSRI